MFPKHPIESHLRTQWVKRKRRTTGYHQNIKTFEGSVRTVVLSSTTISFCNHSNTIHFKIPPIDQPPSPESIFQNKVANQIPFPVLDILFFFFTFLTTHSLPSPSLLLLSPVAAKTKPDLSRRSHTIQLWPPVQAAQNALKQPLFENGNTTIPFHISIYLFTKFPSCRRRTTTPHFPTMAPPEKRRNRQNWAELDRTGAKLGQLTESLRAAKVPVTGTENTEGKEREISQRNFAFFKNTCFSVDRHCQRGHGGLFVWFSR